MATLPTFATTALPEVNKRQPGATKEERYCARRGGADAATTGGEETGGWAACGAQAQTQRWGEEGRAPSGGPGGWGGYAAQWSLGERTFAVVEILAPQGPSG